MNEAIQNMITRRSIRAFTDEKVKLDDLQTILMAGSFAPCGKGLQNWRFTAVQNETTLKQVNEAIRLAYLTYPVDASTHPHVLNMIEKAENQQADYMYGAPIFVMVTHLKEESNAMADSALAIGNMMLAAHSLGLASCWLNHLPRLTHQPIVQELLSTLRIPDNHIVYGSFVLGYAKEVVRNVAPRKDVIHII